jgi:hypothetical protein
MASIADLYMRVRPDVSKLGAELKTGGEKAADTAGKGAGKRYGGGFAAGIGGVLAAGALVGFFKGAFDEAKEAARVTKLTEAVIRSTGGAAKVTAGDVDRLATRLSNMSGVDDELIASSQNVLLTFTGIRNELGKGNDVFNQATGLALDMSTALGTDLQGATIQVGKALNDPIKGITALSRVGVSFTQQQKDQIKAMVEAGDTMGAQKVILAELSKEFGGAAKAAASPADKARVAWGNFQEMIGTKLLPVLNKVLEFGLKNQSWLVPLVGAIAALGVVIGVVMVATKAWAAIMVIAKVATAAWAVAQRILNAAFLSNPIGWIILAIVALVAAIVIAYRNSETFRRIVQAAWQGIQVAIKFAWENVIKPIFTVLVFYYTKVLGPAVLWLWNNIIKPAWAGISQVIQIAWTVIQVAFKAWMFYIRGVIVPTLLWLWNNIIGPTFKAIGAAIKFAWEKVIQPVLSALGGFIRDKVAPAFSKGVDAIEAAWNRVKKAATGPVNFVIGTVINQGILGTWRKIAGFFGVDTSNIKDLPLINQSPYQGISRSGDGPGIGDGLGDLLKGPGRYISNKVGLGRIADRFGRNPFVSLLTGMGGKAQSALLGKAQSLISSLVDVGGGSVGAGGLRSGILAVLGGLRGAFGSVPIISGFRPGARTLSGALSYHALGRAIDIAPIKAWAAYLAGTYGNRLRELITPWQQYNRLNGYPHTYTGAVWQQHNFAGGNAHIHAAMDSGGYLMPGWNPPIYNGTGRPEAVIPAGRFGGDFHAHFHGPVTSQRQAEELVWGAYNRLRQKRRLP